jgi:bifunctional non-homologous end joining protein LigD
VQDAILNGELVCLDADGHSQLMGLMRHRKDACYYAFDLLWLNGADLRQQPLLGRKAELRKLVRGRPGIVYADHLRGAGVEIFRSPIEQLFLAPE